MEEECERNMEKKNQQGLKDLCIETDIAGIIKN